MYTIFPNILPYISSLCPALSYLFYSQSTDPQVSLWLTSPSVVAGLHYDMEDNFLLQVAGNKTVTLISPEAGPAVQTYASYHPFWRQSQLGVEMTTVEGLFRRVRGMSPLSGGGGHNRNDTNSGAGGGSGGTNIDNTDSYNDSFSNTAQSVFDFNINYTSNAVIWSVELTPGDLLYIPSGVYHTVRTGTESVSINMWYSSTMSEVYRALLNVQLPFESYDTLSMKLTNLGIVFRKLFVDFRLCSSIANNKQSEDDGHNTATSTFDVFVSAFHSRYSHLSEDKMFMCDDYTQSSDYREVSQEVCTSNDRLIGESKVLNTRVAGNIHSLLSHSKLSDALTLTLIEDYLEEILQLIFKGEKMKITPCVVRESKLSASLVNFLGPDDNCGGLDKIVPFCPDTLLRYLRSGEFPPPLQMGDESTDNVVPCFSFIGACMLVDISGFSKFSGAMCSQGVTGLDELRSATNTFLGHFVRTVYEYDGDVIAFAGDALICVFQDIITGSSAKKDSSPSQLPPHPPRTQDAVVGNCCYRAIQCAGILRTHEAKSLQSASSLSTHIGLSFGQMHLALLGGSNDQYVHVLNGECVSELASCITDAQSKQVVVTQACFDKATLHKNIHHNQVVDSANTVTPNILISPMLASGIQRGQSSHRHSFHERIGLIKRYSQMRTIESNYNMEQLSDEHMSTASGNSGSNSKSSSQTNTPNSTRPPSGTNSKQSQRFFNHDINDNQSASTELDEVVLLKRNTRANSQTVNFNSTSNNHSPDSVSSKKQLTPPTTVSEQTSTHSSPETHRKGILQIDTDHPPLHKSPQQT
eukprot:gene23172-29366_t